MKRRALQIMVLLLLGAIVNVAVAWGCAIWSPSVLKSAFVDRPNSEDQLWWETHRPDRSPSEATVVWNYSGRGIHSRKMLGDHSGNATFGTSGKQSTFYAGNSDLFDSADEIRSGWPMVALTGSVWRYDVTLQTPAPVIGQSSPPPMGNDMQMGAIEMDRSKWLGGSSYRILPWRFIWPNFAINTIFYAAFLWLLFSVPLALRRRRRMRRGQCPACAYPVGTSPVCTECGKSLV